MRARTIAILICLAGAAGASATDFYVATSGDDSAAGTSEAPWRTLQHAVEQSGPGDTILLRTGSYAGARIERSGRRGAPIVVRPATGAAVRLDRESPRARHDSIVEIENFDGVVRHLRIEGFEIVGAGRSGIDVRVASDIAVVGNRISESGLSGIFTAFADRMLIENNESFANGEHGVYASNSGDRPIIRRNLLWNNAASGIHMNGDASQGGDGVISGAKVDRNVIFGNGRLGGSGINMDGVSKALVRNNLLFDEHASGISLFQIDGGTCTRRVKVYNNTVLVAEDGRWALNMPDAGCDGNRVVNNILYTAHPFRGAIAVYEQRPAGFVSTHNVVRGRFSIDGGDTVIDLAGWRALGHGRGTVVAEPAEIFIDPEEGDFDLRPGSPARDAGRFLKRVKRDLLGRARSRPYDVGALESD